MSESVCFAGLMPHPPVVVPGVGGGREGAAAATVAAMREFAYRLLESDPNRVVLISPHAPRRGGWFGLHRGESLEGNLARFHAPDVGVSFPCDDVFAARLSAEMHALKLRAWSLAESLDHGAVVPLWFLAEAGWKGPTVVVGLGDGNLEAQAALARAIRETCEASMGRTALIASGDMSHRLAPGAPSGFHPRAKEFDAAFVDTVRRGDFAAMGGLDGRLRDVAGEDVVDSSMIVATAIGNRPRGHEVLSYEGPFGVGYCIAIFRGADSGVPRNLAQLARAAVELHVRTGEVLSPPAGSPVDFNRRAATFVTIRTRGGDLRGCIGGIIPARENVALETIDRAIAAAARDRRFEPVRRDELDDLTYEVSVLHEPEAVVSFDQLDPAVYGVIVGDSQGRRAVMLPGVEGLETPEEQLAATRRKAGIPPGTPIAMQRFRVDKIHEDDDV